MGEVKMSVPRLRRIGGAYYWRPTPAIKDLGFENVALGKDLAKAVTQAERLNAAVNRAKAGKPAEPTPGSIAWVIRVMLTDPHFDQLAKGTRGVYRQVLGEIERSAGDIMAAAVTRKDLKETYKAILPRGIRIAQEHMKVWRLIMGRAYDLDLRDDNPALKLGIKQPKPRRQLWSWDQVMVFCGAALRTGRESIFRAALIAYASGQRPGDVRLLALTRWDGEAIWLPQSKTGQEVAIQVEDWLQPSMTRWSDPRRLGALHFIINENTGRPYTETNFCHAFAAVRKAAGLPGDLQMRDLRRTALSEANAGGATIPDMQGLGGHKGLQTLPVYIVPTPERSAAAQVARNEGRSKVARLVESRVAKDK